MSQRRRMLFLLGGSVLAAAQAAFSQQTDKVARIGYLSHTSPATDKAWMAAFEQGLKDLGYIEGKNVVIERRRGAIMNVASVGGSCVIADRPGGGTVVRAHLGVVV